MNTKKSPLFYSAQLMIAQKYLSVGDKANADKFLDVIVNDENAPQSVLVNAQMLK